MCSSPKGGSTNPLLSSNVDSLTGDMSSSDYSSMVHRANESYERRQEELKAYRKTHKNKLSTDHKKPLHNIQPEVSFFEKVKAFFSQTGETQSLDS